MAGRDRNNQIFDQSDLKKYRTEIPNLIDDLVLSVYAKAIYLHIKRWSGTNDGKCERTTRQIAEHCKISVSTTHQAKQELVRAGVIKIEKINSRRGPTDLITILDIWERNFEFYSKGKRSVGERLNDDSTVRLPNASELKESKEESKEESVRLPNAKANKIPSVRLPNGQTHPSVRLPNAKADLSVRLPNVMKEHDPEKEHEEGTPLTPLQGGVELKLDSAVENSSNQEEKKTTKTQRQKPTKKPALKVTPDRQAEIEQVFTHWQKGHGYDDAKLLNPSKRFQNINDRLEDGYTVKDLQLASFGCKFSPHHMGENDRRTKYDDLELICRSPENVDKFMALGKQHLPKNGNGRDRPIDPDSAYARVLANEKEFGVKR